MKVAKTTKKALVRAASAGGTTTAQKHGKKHMSKIGALGAEARWGKK